MITYRLTYGRRERDLMKKDITLLLIINTLAFIFTILISVFGIGGVRGYFCVMALVLSITIFYLAKRLISFQKNYDRINAAENTETSK